MSLREYFEKAPGVGVLSFIMSDRLYHANVMADPRASYLFIELGDGYLGRRLTLTKVKEETDPDKIKAIRRRGAPDRCEDDKARFLVTFRVDGERHLVGDAPLAG